MKKRILVLALALVLLSTIALAEGARAIALTDSMFTVDTSDETYYGYAITKSITGWDGSRRLSEGADYTVTYKSNDRAGTAQIAIVGQGDYIGSLAYTFTIKRGSYIIDDGGFPATGGTPVQGETAVGEIAVGEAAVYTSTAFKPASELYGDVMKNSWYENGVSFVTSKGIFQGVADGTFAPEGEMTRAMLVTALARLDGVDTKGGDTWYRKGMDWAVAQGISDGTRAEARITREQLVTMLYRYKKADSTGTLEGFTDAADVSGWAAQAMSWAVELGILTGKDGGRLDPQGTATRAEVAVLLRRFVEKQ